jgi:predicted DNA-binding transcriptional regulator AlpA
MAHSLALIDQASVSLPVSQDYSSESHVLDCYLRREELAQQLGVSARTIDRWHTLRCGPPRISVGRTILYHLDSIRQWLRANEESDVSRSSSKRERRYRLSRDAYHRASRTPLTEPKRLSQTAIMVRDHVEDHPLVC